MRISTLLVSFLAISVSSAFAPNTRHGKSWIPPTIVPPTTAIDRDIQSHCNTNTPLRAIPPHVWTSLVPPFLGLYKSEWTVSLGYGTAVAWTAAALARRVPPTLLAVRHAAPLVFYGIRLNVFLIFRNIRSKRIQETNQRIEDRALAKGNRFVTRLPFILSCGILYYGLAIPVWFTGKLPTPLMGWQRTLLNSLIASQWFGFGVAALGDFTKTQVKAREKNEQFLVTTGIFSWVRHPNYVGEIIGWTGNALMGLVSMTMGLPFSHVTPKLVVNVGLLGLGWVGILFVLLRATTTLESRQAKDYGQLEAYQSWIAKSWGGWQLPKNNKPANDLPVLPQLELDEASIEESGSGI